MSVLVVTQHTGPDISFVPEPYRQEFLEAVIELYYQACEREAVINRAGTRASLLPDAIEDISLMSDDFFVIGAVAMDHEDDNAFGKILADPDLTEGDKQDLLEGWHEEYSYHLYNSWREDYYDDVCKVLQYYHMSFVTSHCSPVNPTERWVELHNYPIIEVW